MRINRKQASLSNKHWSKYVAAGAAGTVAALGAQTTVDADLTWVPLNQPIQDLNAFDGSFSFIGPFTFGAAGVASFRIGHANEIGGGQEVTTIEGMGAISFIGQTGGSGSFFYPSNIPYGQNVAAGPFNILAGARGDMAWGSGYDGSQFLTAGTGYIGFRFDLGAGTQYGFIEVEMDGAPTNTGTIVGYAYGMPGEQVFAGTFPAQVTAVYANGTAWDNEFRDQVDGTNDGSTFGYELLNRADQTVTVPWINVDELVVVFDAPIDFGSLDLGDFVIGEASIPGTKFVDGSGVPGVIPAITDFELDGPNAVRLTLSSVLEPSIIELNVNASGITFNSGLVAGNDLIYPFRALPGDVEVNSAWRVQTGDILDIAPRINALIGDPLYSFRANVDGNFRIQTTDVLETNDRINDFLIFSRPTEPSREDSEDREELNRKDAIRDLKLSSTTDSVDPEPGALGILAMGSVGLLAWRRKRGISFEK